MFDSNISTDFARAIYRYSATSNLQRVVLLPSWAISSQYVIAHEMGHTYGMPHSTNNDSDSNPYDNPWDVMSDAFFEFFQSPFGKVGTPSTVYNYKQVGFLPNSRLFTLGNNSTVTITIDDWMLSSTGNYYAAFIPIAGSSLLYTVEVHKGTSGGFNSDYRPEPLDIPVDAVIIYKVDPSAPTDLARLMGGNTDDMAYGMEGAWTVGETFEDVATDISIEVLGTTADGFQVRLTQGTPIETIIPVSPAHQSVLTNALPTFSWTEAPSAATYKVQVTSSVSSKKLSLDVTSASCVASVCSVTPDLASLGWAWDDGVTYKWSVTGKTAGGEKAAKSAKNAFTTDVMPNSIVVTSPVSGTILIDTSLSVQFVGDARVSEYRVQVTRGTKTLKGAWTAYATACAADPCTITLDLAAFKGGAKDGKHGFRVLGRNPLSIDQTKSGNTKFKLDR
jgi:hypothetical protein